MKGEYKKLIEENSKTSELLYDFYKNLTFLFTFDEEQKENLYTERKSKRPIESKRIAFASSLLFLPFLFVGDANIRPLNLRESKSPYASDVESDEESPIASDQIVGLESDYATASESISTTSVDSIDQESLSSNEIRRLERQAQRFETSTEVRPITSRNQIDSVSPEDIDSIESGIVSSNESPIQQDEIVRQNIEQIDSQAAKEAPKISFVKPVIKEAIEASRSSNLSPNVQSSESSIDSSTITSNPSSILNNRFVQELSKNVTETQEDFIASQEKKRKQSKKAKSVKESIEEAKREVESISPNKSSIAKKVESSTKSAIETSRYAKPSSSKEASPVESTSIEKSTSVSQKPVESKVSKVQNSYRTVTTTRTTSVNQSVENETSIPVRNRVQSPTQSNVQEPTRRRRINRIENNVQSPTQSNIQSPTQSNIQSPTQSVSRSPTQSNIQPPTQSNVLVKERIQADSKKSERPPKATTPVSNFSISNLDQYRKFKYLADVEMYYERTKRDRETLISIERELNEIRERNVLNDQVMERIRSLVYHKVQASGRIKKELEKLKEANPNPNSYSMFEIEGSNSSYSMSQEMEGGEEGLGGNESDTEIPTITVFPGVTEAIQDFLDKAID